MTIRPQIYVDVEVTKNVSFNVICVNFRQVFIKKLVEKIMDGHNYDKHAQIYLLVIIQHILLPQTQLYHFFRQ